MGCGGICNLGVCAPWGYAHRGGMRTVGVRALWGYAQRGGMHNMEVCTPWRYARRGGMHAWGVWAFRVRGVSIKRGVPHQGMRHWGLLC